MDKDGFVAARIRLEMTHDELARHLGVDIRTTKRWAAGERAIPEPVARLIAYIERYGPELAIEMMEKER